MSELTEVSDLYVASCLCGWVMTQSWRIPHVVERLAGDSPLTFPFQKHI
jgi:hypothetical protein